MVFAYYTNLSKAGKAIYRQSDRIETLSISNADLLQKNIQLLRLALQEEDRKKVEVLSKQLLHAIAGDIKAPLVNLRVMASRPTNDIEELHGLYEPVDGNKRARITVWMRTAKYKKVVAFRSFLRTLLHELCHHLDYEFFMLQDSFHTEGFFKRESSLLKQVLKEE